MNRGFLNCNQFLLGSCEGLMERHHSSGNLRGCHMRRQEMGTSHRKSNLLMADSFRLPGVRARFLREASTHFKGRTTWAGEVAALPEVA